MDYKKILALLIIIIFILLTSQNIYKWKYNNKINEINNKFNTDFIELKQRLENDTDTKIIIEKIQTELSLELTGWD